MKKNEKYTGRTYEELLKVKVGDMTGEEYEFLKSKKGKDDSEPSTFNTVIFGTKGLIKKAYRGVSDKTSSMIDEIKELANTERLTAKQEKEFQEKLKEVTEHLKRTKTS